MYRRTLSVGNVCWECRTHHDKDVLALVGLHIFRDRTKVPRLEGVRPFERAEEPVFARAFFVAHAGNEGDARSWVGVGLDPG